MRVEEMPAAAGSTATPTADDRILSLDVLRGFALFGILMVNMAHFALPTMYLAGAHAATGGGALDHAADWVVMTFGAGKFFPLFSFLFGLGLAIQFLSWQGKHLDTTRMFARRLGGLAVIGLCHALFVWAGDILVKYAALGAMFIVALRLPPRLLLVGAAGLLALPMALGAIGVDDWLAAAAGLPDSPEGYRALADSATAAYTSGSFLEMTAQRARDFAFRFSGWSYVSGLFTILSMFCLGAYAGLTGLFRAPVATTFRAILAGSAAVWVLCMADVALAHAVPALAVPQLGKGVKLALNLSTTGMYIGGIVLLLERAAWRRRLAPLSQAGRMALTNYLLQSVLATAFFYWGGFYGHVGAAGCMALTLAIYTLQVVVSGAWMRRFRFGPAEWLWRWATYGKRPAFRRTLPAIAPVPQAPSTLAG